MILTMSPIEWSQPITIPIDWTLEHSRLSGVPEQDRSPEWARTSFFHHGLAAGLSCTRRPTCMYALYIHPQYTHDCSDLRRCMRYELSYVYSPDAPVLYTWPRLRESRVVPGAVAVAATGSCYCSMDMSAVFASRISRDLGRHMGCLCTCPNGPLL